VRQAPGRIVFDTGALIGVDRASSELKPLLRRLHFAETQILVPTTVVAQAWRHGARQALLARFLGNPQVTILPFTAEDALAAGVLCGATGTSDIVDAAVVVAAHTAGTPFVVTSDSGDLRKLDPRAALTLYQV